MYNNYNDAGERNGGVHQEEKNGSVVQGEGEEWVVRVWTSDIRGAGTDAAVSVQVYYAHRN